MSEKYALVDAECATLAGDEACAPTVTQACEWLGDSKSGYYDWRSRPQSAVAERRELLNIKVKALFEANNEEYGYRRVHAALDKSRVAVHGKALLEPGIRRLRQSCGPGEEHLPVQIRHS